MVVCGRRRVASIIAVECVLVCFASHAASGAEVTLDLRKSGLVKEMLADPEVVADEIVFAARPLHNGGHAYESFGYNYGGGRIMVEGGRLYRLNLRAGRLQTLLEDETGSVRDPAVHYEGERILFSYREGGTDYHHLYEIRSDGSGLRQVTDDAPYDDVEPCYLPDDGIVFVSSRAQRWVPCFVTQVGTLFCCDADGKDIRRLSPHVDHDLCPWVLRDGRIVFTRWDYVDRSEGGTFSLWTMRPDGTQLSVLYHGHGWIDVKPIPDSTDVVAIQTSKDSDDHVGKPVVINVNVGPDGGNRGIRLLRGCDGKHVRDIPKQNRDPYPLSDRWFLVAGPDGLYLVDDREGRNQRIVSKEDVGGLDVHEPCALGSRVREPLLPPQTAPETTTGRMVVQDVYVSRPKSLEGISRGEIAKILVLESLPAPIHITHHPNQIGFGSIWNIKRVLGTFPVEPDGSAHVEVPAMRSLQFVALDEEGRGIKRMHTVINVMPGETVGCVGCHEGRHTTLPDKTDFAALRRPPSQLDREGVPEIIDYPRHIQPIWDRHCVRCHNTDRMDGGITISGDRGIAYSHSIVSLVGLGHVSTVRCRGNANPPPRSIGSPASRLLDLLRGDHYRARLSDDEYRLVLRWIDVGAPYLSTYATEGTGFYKRFELPPDVLGRRCASCHGKQQRPGEHRVLLNPARVAALEEGSKNRRLEQGRDVLVNSLLVNLTHPEKSLVLRAPLKKKAGGLELCKTRSGSSAVVFADAHDADYQAILEAIVEVRPLVNSLELPGFQPHKSYFREMMRYGVLPQDFDPETDRCDYYELDQRYWSQQYQPILPPSSFLLDTPESLR